MITNIGIKAYRKVGQHWEEIQFNCFNADLKEKVMPLCDKSLVFSGQAIIEFAGEVESIFKILRMKPEVEKWKSSGKRKMPRIK